MQLNLRSHKSWPKNWLVLSWLVQRPRQFRGKPKSLLHFPSFAISFPGLDKAKILSFIGLVVLLCLDAVTFVLFRYQEKRQLRRALVLQYGYKDVPRYGYEDCVGESDLVRFTVGSHEAREAYTSLQRIVQRIVQYLRQDI